MSFIEISTDFSKVLKQLERIADALDRAWPKSEFRDSKFEIRNSKENEADYLAPSELQQALIQEFTERYGREPTNQELDAILTKP